jgi:carboxypeptidase family protein
MCLPPGNQTFQISFSEENIFNMHYRKLMYFALLIATVAIFACGGGEEKSSSSGTPSATPAAPAGGNAYDASKATATISGKVTLTGTPAAPAPLPLTPECKQAHGDKPAVEQSVEVNSDGTMKDVLVYVKSGAEKWTYATPTEPVVLDQQGCEYHPHMVAIMQNQPLKIRNSDPFLHNIHPMPKNNPQFNMGQPVKGMESEKTFANAEITIPVKCDVHRWMNAHIAVMNNPFYSITGDSGSFSIKLPAGTYTVEAWTEKFGAQTQNVTVTDNGTQEINFTFKAS